MISFVADVDTLDVDRVAETGRRMWEAFVVDHAFSTLVEECSTYSMTPWPRMGGMMALLGFDASQHAQGYIIEGLRAMVIYAAVGGMVPLPTTVDDAMHAAFTQQDVMRDVARRLGIVPEHRTTQESHVARYQAGCVTDDLYVRIFGTEPPRFFWRDQREIDRVGELTARVLDTLGIGGVSRFDGRITVAEDTERRMLTYLADVA